MCGEKVLRYRLRSGSRWGLYTCDVLNLRERGCHLGYGMAVLCLAQVAPGIVEDDFHLCRVFEVCLVRIKGLDGWGRGGGRILNIQRRLNQKNTDSPADK